MVLKKLEQFWKCIFEWSVDGINFIVFLWLNLLYGIMQWLFSCLLAGSSRRSDAFIESTIRRVLVGTVGTLCTF